MIKPRLVLGTFAPYSVEEADSPVKLDANEYPEDLPPEIKEKIIERFQKLSFNRYPQISALGLRQKIAAGFGLQAENVLLGNGSSQLLVSLCFTFADQERSVVYPYPTFSMYGIYARLADSRGVPVETDEKFTLDRDKLLKTAAAEKAGVILLCNPNNPTGTVIAPADIEHIIANAPCPVVVDEAYYDFYGVSAVNLLAKYPHLVIVRTFSKVYGLAAARVGYILGSPEIIAPTAKTIVPYNLNDFSLCAAETVWSLQGYVAARVAQNAAEREKMSRVLAAIPGVTVFPSQTNFILIKMTAPDTADNAGRLAKYLRERGVGVRDFSKAPGLIGCLRITVGAPEENEKCLKVIKSFPLTETGKEQKI